MKKYKCLNLDDCILPGYEEITGDALYRINGGGRIQPDQNENPPEGHTRLGGTRIYSVRRKEND